MSKSDHDFYRGVNRLGGAKFYTHFGNRLSLTATIGGANRGLYDDLFVNTTIRYCFFTDEETDFSVFLEAGVEVMGPDYTVPLYLGTQQYFGDIFACNFRLRLPTFLDLEHFNDRRFLLAGMEVGFQFDLKKMKTAKKITSGGNPFLLR